MKSETWIKAKVISLTKKYNDALYLARIKADECEMNDYSYEKYYDKAKLIKAELDAYKKVLED